MLGKKRSIVCGDTVLQLYFDCGGGIITSTKLTMKRHEN